MSIRTVYRFTLIMASLLLISGCMTYRYVPAEDSTSPAMGDTSLPVAFQVAPVRVDTHSRVRNHPDWKKIPPTIESALTPQVETLSGESATSQSPYLSMHVENETFKMNWGHFLMYIASIFTLPSSSDMQFDSEMTVNAGGETLFTSQANGSIRGYISVYSPSALFVGKKDPAIASADMANDMMRQHRQALEEWVAVQKQQYDQEIAGKDILEQRQWLIENPHSLFASEILANLASHTPRRNTLGWHRENVSRFPRYVAFLSEEDALWFVGPDGQRVIDLVDAAKRGTSQSILAAQVEAQGPYKPFSDEEIRRLRKSGLSSDLIAAMIRSGNRPAEQPGAAANLAASPRASQQDTVAALLIPDNSGEYMNPWTSDGVLAEWVDKAINAKMGGAIGSAAGAYAASKALENVPFIGGILGSKVGKKVGHSAAISASGGMDYIRETSDQSFRSLDDMARYLKTVHADNSNFQDAIKAADAIYPGLMQSLVSSQ